MLTHFEKKLETEIAKCGTAALGCSPSDPAALAKIQGRANALAEVKHWYREAVKTDLEEAA
jgi:hypothetical protein